MTDEWKAGRGQRIEKLYAWVGEETDGGEGVLGVQVPDGPRVTWLPLIGADKARIESYRRYATDIAVHTGRPVRLKVFGEGVIIDEIERSDKP